ncbi:MAG: cytochrome c oxidase accessory protein CcoG [Proteobacteria bacterium]|nr:cytochrome c oxidase accessory protein CcoG [Pseudomonadota bacterium]
MAVSRISKNDRRIQLEREEAGDHLYANRVRVYPKAVHGMARRVKWAILIACLGLYYVMPWVRWDRGPGRPNQAILLDMAHERYYFFNLELWPQDIWLLAGLLIMGAVTLFLVTSLIGRVWCGYTCPQTVWTDLFMWVERLVEGDRNERMRRDAEPVTFDTVWRKAVKHGVWLFIAFWTGGAWIMYYVDAPTVTVQFWTGHASAQVYFFTLLFTATTYVLAGWAREQVCTYMCPWPRFQSAMLDDQSFTVTYQSWRGEPRVRGKRHEGEAAGDCVDCGACVTACPTGIDIRDGIQLECINCGLCIDACNHVMERTGRDRWLITWDTLARQAAKKAGRFEPIRLIRPRSIIYAGVLLAAMSALTVALALRPTIGLSVQRDRAPLFVTLPDGSLRNGYTVKIANKTQADSPFVLSVAGLPGAVLTVSEESAKPAPVLTLRGAPDQVSTYRVLVTARPDHLPEGTLPVIFELRDGTSGERTTYKSIFMGPATYNGGPP